MKKIAVNGQEYPCGMTMGALLRFKKETGHDVSKADPSDTADMVTLLWCCVASACAAEKKDFTLTLQEFADSCSVEDLNRFNDELAGGDGGSKKK